VPEEDFARCGKESKEWDLNPNARFQKPVSWKKSSLRVWWQAFAAAHACLWRWRNGVILCSRIN